MSENSVPASTLVFGFLSIIAFALFAWLHLDAGKSVQLIQIEGWSRVQFLIVGVAGWLSALMAFRALTKPERQSGLIFAFFILALMIYFVHETYQYSGKVRIFPLIVGYTGIVLSLLDILTTTDSKLGRFTTNLFGSELVASEMAVRPLGRELLVIAGICVGVILIYALGFLAGGAVFVAGWMLIAGRKSILHSLYGGIATFAFVYLLFEVILQYELHRGPITNWVIETYLT